MGDAVTTRSMMARAPRPSVSQAVSRKPRAQRMAGDSISICSPHTKPSPQSNSGNNRRRKSTFTAH